MQLRLFKIIFYGFVISSIYVSIVLFLYVFGIVFIKIKKPINIWPIIDFQIHYYFISGERMIWNGMQDCSAPDIVTIYRPVIGICKNHKNIEYNVSYTFDEFGRSVPNRIINTNQGIAVLGDSVAMGFGVNDTETFSNQLQILLKNKPIYNLGVESFATKREIEHYIKSPAYEKTNLIIFTYHQNDLGENILDLSKNDYKNKSLEWSKNKTTVVINNNLRSKLSIFKRIFLFSLNLLPRTFNKIISGDPKPWVEWNIYEKNFILHYNNFIKIFSNYEKYFHNKKILFIYVNQWGNEFENYKTGVDKNFANLNFLKINLQREDFYIIDDHPNHNGHKSIAKQIYKYLQKL